MCIELIPKDEYHFLYCFNRQTETPFLSIPLVKYSLIVSLIMSHDMIRAVIDLTINKTNKFGVLLILPIALILAFKSSINTNEADLLET